MRASWLGRLVAVGAASLLVQPPAGLAQAARAAYEQVRAREAAVRAKGAERPLSPETAASLIAAYERVARRHPTSPYSDDALWRAASLAHELFKLTSAASHRIEAERLLRWLIREYPASSLVPRARARLEDIAAAATPKPPSPLVERVALPFSRGVQNPPVTVRDIQRVALPAVLRVVVVLDEAVGFHHAHLAGPDRVFLDFPDTEPAPHLANARWSFPGDLVRQIRVGRQPPQTTRVVVELERLTRYTVFTLTDPARVVVDFEREPLGVSASGGGTSTSPARPGVPSGAMKEHSDAPAPTAAGDPKPLDAAPTRLSIPRPPPANRDGTFSLARQLGLGVGRVVIDPGHGGHDPGAQEHGVSEAQVALDVALRLEALLRRRTAMDVVLTRRSDVFVPLEERTALANREEADLFLSIHVNASPSRTVRGVETYFLNFARNPDAEAVAARENAASGQTMRNLPQLLKAIALNAKLAESREFAESVQRSLVRRLRPANRALQNLGVKQAPFVVLIGAAMPSVLVEIAFLTNPTEARLLKSPAYRQRIAEALVDGILLYQRSLKAVGTVAAQR